MAAVPKQEDWAKPAALAIPQGGVFKEKVEARPLRTDLSQDSRVLRLLGDREGEAGSEQAIREYGKTVEAAVKGDPTVLAPLRLHYLRWVLFDVGSGLHFQYQGIFDTDFDKYIEDAIALFNSTGITRSSPISKAGRMTGARMCTAVIKFFREHQCPSFLEYGEYPYVSADEIKKALRIKESFSHMLDHMQ